MWTPVEVVFEVVLNYLIGEFVILGFLTNFLAVLS